MAEEKRYWFLQVEKDFFKQREIKKLRTIAGGDTFTIIYLELMLKSLIDNGKLYFEQIDDSFAEEIALEIDEDSENVKITLNYLKAKGLFIEISETEFFLSKVPSMVKAETAAAERMRRMRAKEKSNNVTKKRNEVQNGYVEKEQEKESNKDINKKQETDVLFDNYFQIFSNFTKGIKSQPRVDAMHAFAELSPEQRDKALIGANNYVTWYQNSGNDIQYSKNAAVFLKDLIFIDYQEMPEDKSGYDPELGF